MTVDCKKSTRPQLKFGQDFQLQLGSSLPPCARVPCSCRPPMPGRGPRVSKDVVVWSRVQDLLSDHPQLKEKFDEYFPAGHVGKYIQGQVASSCLQCRMVFLSWKSTKVTV